MLEVPPLTMTEQSPLLAISSQKLGGAGKSLVVQILVDAIFRSDLDLHLFENDGQHFYDCYGAVQSVQLPPTEEVVHDPVADVRVHSDFDRSLREAGANDCIVYDCAAASINRHTYVVDQLDVGLRVAAMNRHVLVLVVSSSREDIAREAVETFEVWRDLLPEPHRVVPVISQRDGDVNRLPNGHDLHKLLRMASHGALLLPRIPMTIVNDMRRSGMKLCELADPRDPLSTSDMAARARLDPTSMQMVRRSAGTLLSETDGQLMRLGFTLGL